LPNLVAYFSLYDELVEISDVSAFLS